MKITLLTFFILLPLYGISQRQNLTVFGLKGGFNKSMIDGTDSYGGKTGYRGLEIYGSLFADTRIAERTGVQTELLFSYTDSYHFIEIPVNVKVNLYKRFSVFAGPKMDFIVDNEPPDSYYYFKTFGVAFDSGLEFRLTNTLFSEFRYAYCITRQINDYGLDIRNARRSTLRLGLGIKF